MGRPRRFNNYDKDVRDVRDQTEKAGRTRQDYSGIGSSLRAMPTLPPQKLGDESKLSLQWGGEIRQAIGFTASSNAISTGTLDITKKTDGTIQQSRGIVYVSPESGTTDDLANVTGKLYNGQVLFLFGVTGNTITVKHAAGGAGQILCPGNSDYTLEADEGCILVDDVTASNVWRLLPGDVGSGGGGFTDPLEQKVNAKGNVNTNQTIDASTANITTMTLTGDIAITSITDSLSAGSPYELIHVIVDQDGTGGHDITSWPASVNGTPTIDQTASTRTDIVLYTEDQGTNWYFTVSSGSVSGGGGSQSPWTSDIDADGYDLNDLSNILFRNSAGLPVGTDRAIWYEDTTGMHFNALTGDYFDFEVNDSSKIRINHRGINFPTTLTAPNATGAWISKDADAMLFNVPTGDQYEWWINGANPVILSHWMAPDQYDLTFPNAFKLRITDDNTRIQIDSGGMEFEVPANDTYEWQIASAIIATMSSTVFDINGLILRDVNDIEFSTNTGYIQDNTNDLTINIESSTPPASLILAMNGQLRYSLDDTGTFTIYEGEAGVSEDPTLRFENNGLTAINNIFTKIEYVGEDALGNDHIYAVQGVVPRNVTNGSELGEFQWWVAKGGADALNADTIMSWGYPDGAGIAMLKLRGDNEQVDVELNRDSMTGTGAISNILWRADNGAGTPVKHDYATIEGSVRDRTSGSEDGRLRLTAISNGSLNVMVELDGELGLELVNGTASNDKLGFYGHTPVTHPTVSGARDTPEAALANLLSALDSLGLINNTTTAT